MDDDKDGPGTFSINDQPVDFNNDAELLQILKDARPRHQQRELTPEERAERRRLVSAARGKANAITTARRAKRRAAEVEDYGRSFEGYVQKNWERFSGRLQAEYNELRRVRGLAPLSPVKIPVKPEEYVAPPEQLRPFDPNDPEVIAAYLEFCGDGDQAEEWKRIAKQSAIQQARDQLDTQKPRLTKRDLNKERLWRAIAKFVDVAQSMPEEKRKDWPRKRIIGKACDHFGVSPSTVEEAIKQYRKKFHFTDGSMLTPAK
jgi:hypothetical protein